MSVKKIVLTIFLLIPILLWAQYRSWDGARLSPQAKVHSLNVFINVIYDVNSEKNVFANEDYWPRVIDPALEGVNNTAIPNYLLDWMDLTYNPKRLHGTCTRLYGESSFDNLQITGDFIVVNVRESAVLQKGFFSEANVVKVAFDMISRDGFRTVYGDDNIENYDANHDHRLDYVNVMIRNITRAYGGDNPGSGVSGCVGTLLINGENYSCEAGTTQCVGDGDFFSNPSSIVIHEISHALFGGNNFHTSGGNHRGSRETMVFLNIQNGYGLMGAAGSGLVSCNGYERWRMHWKHPQSVDYIAALDAQTAVSVPSDISMNDGPVAFILRDFVTYGDAIRIKLPYKDAESSENQYIWLENHQVGKNRKLDYLQFSNTYSCRPFGVPGIYAYYQVGRDVLEGDHKEVWDNNSRDNLKVISAEGYYDYEFVPESHNLECVSYQTHDYALRRGAANAFCGGQDQESQFFPKERDTVLYVNREMAMWRKLTGRRIDDHLPSLGDELDAFGSYAKINMGTNPSTCNTKTYHSYNASGNPAKIMAAKQEMNTRTTYLTGLGIEMIRQKKNNVLVKIRWDDYEIVNDARWTGRIVLKDTAILTTPHTITLAQNRTVSLPYRDQETGLFAERTRWVCEPGSYFRQDSASTLSLTENSTLQLQAGSRYEQAPTAALHLQSNCKLLVEKGAILVIEGLLEIEENAVVEVQGTLVWGASSRLIIHSGAQLITDEGEMKEITIP